MPPDRPSSSWLRPGVNDVADYDTAATAAATPGPAVPAPGPDTDVGDVRERRLRRRLASAQHLAAHAPRRHPNDMVPLVAQLQALLEAGTLAEPDVQPASTHRHSARQH